MIVTKSDEAPLVFLRDAGHSSWLCTCVRPLAGTKTRHIPTICWSSPSTHPTDRGKRSSVPWATFPLGPPRTGFGWPARSKIALVGQLDLFSNPDPEVEQIVRQVRARGACSSPEPIKPARDSDRSGDLVTVHTDRVTATRHRTAGPVHVGFQFWKRLGFDAILKQRGFSVKAIRLTCAMTLNRLIHPNSEHAMPDWIRSTGPG